MTCRIPEICEVVGSGDATQAYQRFSLDKPVHCTPVAPERWKADVAVIVNGGPWTLVASFRGYGPNDQVYELHIRADGTAFVSLGDGIHGARLPTGHDNVVIRYATAIEPVTNPVGNPITQRGMMQPQVEAVPAFKPHWEVCLDGWEGEGEQDTPNYLALSMLADQLILKLEKGEDSYVRAAFTVVERWIIEGDDYVQNATCVGLFEDL